CPAPKLTSLELVEAQSDWLLVRWHVANDSLVGGFSLTHLNQQQQNPSWSQSIQLPAQQRLMRLEQLDANSDYTLCIQADGKYLQALSSNSPTAYVVDRQRDHSHHLASSNRKCIQVSIYIYIDI